MLMLSTSTGTVQAGIEVKAARQIAALCVE